MPKVKYTFKVDKDEYVTVYEEGKPIETLEGMFVADDTELEQIKRLIRLANVGEVVERRPNEK